MSAIVTTIVSVTPYGDNLSIVETKEGNKVVANRKEDGSFRWAPGEIAVYVSEGSILPDDVLKDRGYWDTEKDRGLLGGGKRNRVKMSKLGPDKFESRGLLFKTHSVAPDFVYDGRPVHAIVSNSHENMEREENVMIGDDVSSLFDITEFAG